MRDKEYHPRLHQDLNIVPQRPFLTGRLAEIRCLSSNSNTRIAEPVTSSYTSLKRDIVTCNFECKSILFRRMNIKSYLSQGWSYQLVVPAVLILLALIVILAINWRKSRARWLEWNTHRNLDKIGIKQIKNAVCSDGLDGELEIDRLVMLHDSILLIAFRPYAGNIYCAEKITEWTQVTEQKSYKFKNPLFELDNQVMAIRNYFPGASIRGVLIFDHYANFPKGHPDQVMLPDHVPDSLLQANCPEPRPEILRCWDALLKLPLRRDQMPQYQ
jgi:hypothetical protein